MYDKFYLSKKDINIINKFQENQLLIIHGKPGTGKKTLAKEIMNNSTIHVIDSSFLNSSSGKSMAIYAPIVEPSTADIDNDHENLKLDTPFDLKP